VGKTSVACALALAVASEQSPTLLVSTDPAPSIADALATIVTDEERSIENAPGLTARQMDAAAAFDRLRTTYQERIDALFDSFVAHGLDAAHDRAILRELLSLAPPGIDELYALASLGETLSEGAYAQVIVDPAPTGHLLRLLEMPAMALDWSHRLMRLMLKYRDVGMLGETAEEVLAFSRRTRALQTLLHDASRAAVVVVSLDEPLVRGETSRLVQAVRSRGLAITGLLWNRLDEADPATPLVTDATAQYRAPAAVPPPVGLDALRAWTARWCALDPAPDSHSDTPLASHA
jgi:arsenite-transporting ATPase